MGHHDEAHQGVRSAAELGALAGIDARGVGLQAQDVAPTGDHVLLAAQARDPEAMDHVG